MGYPQGLFRPIAEYCTAFRKRMCACIKGILEGSADLLMTENRNEKSLKQKDMKQNVNTSISFSVKAVEIPNSVVTNNPGSTSQDVRKKFTEVLTKTQNSLIQWLQ